ncbi:hypothetical protein KJ570_01015 [Patescibacteria group bacterium]|nr:hypothetical protein [Patescibacteria group bacterium]MBU2036553.1 hypothetical protein [Patescibacteria group bacterium]
MYLPTTKGKLIFKRYIKISIPLFIFFLSFLFLIFSSNFTKSTLGKEPEKPKEDYHSFRPNPKDPAYDELEDLSLLCGNDIIINKKIEVGPGEGSCSQNGDILTCSYKFRDNVSVAVDTAQSRLPIMGNTQLVYNKDNKVGLSNSEELDDTEKVNNLVSWYLNGAVNYAENPHPISNLGSLVNEWWTGYYANVINFSGPLRKLLPQDVQYQNKIEQIENATGSNKGTELERNDQIVGCTFGIDTPIMLLQDVINVLLKIMGIDAIDLPGARILNFIGPCHIGIKISIFDIIEIDLDDFKKEYKLSDFQGHLPPLIEQYNDPSNPKAWWVAYEKWRGKSCIVIPGWKFIPDFLKNQGICFENPLKPNAYADLFMNIPMSSTEDRVGKLTINEPVPSSSDGVKVEVSEFELKQPAILYFPHMQESLGLAEELQTTFKPQEGTDDNLGYTKPVDISENCQILQVRTNEEPDDFLWGEEALAKFKYKAEFECTFQKKSEIVCSGSNCHTVEKYIPAKCEKNISFNSKIDTYTPLADEVWSRLVAGNSAIARRMFPKTGTDVFGSFIDMPTVTTAQYKVQTGNVSVEPATTEIYFPHIGGVSEYFLKGIQTLLRPKGYGENITFSEAGSSNGDGSINCNQNISDIAVPGLNKAEGKRVSDIWYGPGVGKAYFEECNNDVIQRANSKGVNPIFTLAIWIHESGASNYEATTPVEDFGIHGSSSAPPNNFSAQLDVFLNLPDSYSSKCGKKSLETFISMFWFGHCAPQNDYEKDELYRYIDELNFIYSVIAPGVTLPNYPK